MQDKKKKLLLLTRWPLPVQVDISQN